MVINCYRYTPHELKYLPLNSTLFSPPRAEGNIYAPGPDDEENDEAADRKVIESLNKQVSSSVCKTHVNNHLCQFFFSISSHLFWLE